MCYRVKLIRDDGSVSVSPEFETYGEAQKSETLLSGLGLNVGVIVCDAKLGYNADVREGVAL